MDYTWDDVDVDEQVTDSDHKQADNMTVQSPVGKMICTVMESNPVEKSLNKYDCMAAALKMRIDRVLKIEQPVLDKNGQPISREGETVYKIQDVPPEKDEEIQTIYKGQFVRDEIFLYNPKEKEAMKKRRLFVAKRLGIVAPNATQIGGKDWAKAPGKQVIVTTEWNKWTDKDTKEVRKNVKVGWSGYESLEENNGAPDNTKASQTQRNTTPPNNDFSDI